jgi:hypothetical protein
LNVVTHALLPALMAVPFLPRTDRPAFYRSAGLVALAGALPDLLCPHLSLAGRYTSWSHTVFAYAGFNLVLLGLALLPRIRILRRTLLLASLAWALHLAMDGISGGIAWLYPFSGEVLGERLVRYYWWFRIDVVLTVIAIAVFWLWPACRRNRASQPERSAPSEGESERAG